MKPTCTVTGTSGRKVSGITLSHLLREELLPLVKGSEWHFCADSDCDVVYFTSDGKTLSKDALQVRVGMKESESPRPLCYCFGYTVEDVDREATSADESSIAAEIAEKCRQGLDRCEETNPQGSCCLGNVRRAFNESRVRRRGSPGNEKGCCNAEGLRELP